MVANDPPPRPAAAQTVCQVVSWMASGFVLMVRHFPSVTLYSTFCSSTVCVCPVQNSYVRLSFAEFPVFHILLLVLREFLEPNRCFILNRGLRCSSRFYNPQLNVRMETDDGLKQQSSSAVIFTAAQHLKQYRYTLQQPIQQTWRQYSLNTINFRFFVTWENANEW